MTYFESNAETIDFCVACGRLRVQVVGGRVVARRLDGAGTCQHTFHQREALRAEILTQPALAGV